jgi:hypothetical protein
MKKTYIQPQMFVSEFELEGLIAVSLQMVSDENDRVSTSNGEQLTNKHNGPWSATNWE